MQSILIVLMMLQNASAVSKHSSCSKDELHLKTCNLQEGSLHLDIQAPKMIVHDGSSVHVTVVPKAVETGDWKSVRFYKLGERVWLEFLVWVLTPEKLPVRDLHWVVAEVRSAKCNFVIDEIVQHDSSGKLEKPLPYTLKLQNRNVVWQAGLKSGIVPSTP
jgi:hypothetical protein